MKKILLLGATLFILGATSCSSDLEEGTPTTTLRAAPSDSEGCAQKEACDVPIVVKTLTGGTFNIRIELYRTVGELKYRIQDMAGIPFDQQRLILAGKQLKDDDAKLKDYGVQANSTLHLVLN